MNKKIKKQLKSLFTEDIKNVYNSLIANPEFSDDIKVKIIYSEDDFEDFIGNAIMDCNLDIRISGTYSNLLIEAVINKLRKKHEKSKSN